MFDLRYHVVSLTAVFLALVIGILVGIGLSGRGFVDDAERENLERDLSAARSERDDARSQLGAAGRRQAAMDDFAASTAAAMVPRRLEDKRVAIVFVGPVDGDVDRAVRAAVRSAGGSVARVRALRVPVDQARIDDALQRSPALRPFMGAEHLDEVGRALGRELAAGGRTPLWDALSDTLVEEREGGLAQPVDAIVVARPAPPQRPPTKDLVEGLYAGIARSDVPAAGVDPAAVAQPAVTAFSRAGLSTVDSIDTDAGRLALVLLLAGAAEGNYGIEETATDGVLPPIEALPATP